VEDARGLRETFNAAGEVGTEEQLKIALISVLIPKIA
jgi:hypothetical protein